ncbi:MAG: hypothetical protein HC767_12920 [Akkermansiaceae bacterium]|nr:hypothetical protein [Akkermansiaceae bacterium]
MLHDRLLDKVLSLPMSFFDTQPSGRLIARFTHDVETTDIDLQDTINSFVSCFAAVIVALAVVAASPRASCSSRWRRLFQYTSPCKGTTWPPAASSTA